MSSKDRPKVGSFVRGTAGDVGEIVDVKKYHMLVKYENGSYGWYGFSRLQIIVKPSINEKQQFEVPNEVKKLANEIKKTVESSSLQQKQKVQVGSITAFACFLLFCNVYFKKKKRTFHSLDQVLKENSSETLKSANELTKQILETPPNGNVNDKNTMLHIMNSIFGGCVFYDSTKNMSLLDSSSAMNDISAEKSLVLQLENLDGLISDKKPNDMDEKKDIEQISEIKAAIQLNNTHPVLETLQFSIVFFFFWIEKLARVHNVPKERIKILDAFLGTVCFKYTVLDLEPGTIDKYINDRTAKQLASEFPAFRDLKIHPLFLR
ncbi:hypothetical protein RFI_11101, partial [Reticulomyxa filosa]